MTTPAELYGAEYYANFGGEAYLRNDHWLAFFNGIAREIRRSIGPRTVFDSGCAFGMLVESLWDIGVEAQGIDVSEYAIANVRPDMRPYCRTGSVTDPLPRRFDLVTSIEVLEHVDQETALRAIEQIAAATDTVLFTSTPTDFNEPTHVNVRPPIYWIRAFGEHGFRVDLRFDASFLSPHAMLFRKASGYTTSDIEEAYALHILLRSALIEREQRIGVMGNDVRQRAQERDHFEARLTAEVDRSQSLAQSLEEARARERELEAAVRQMKIQAHEQDDRSKPDSMDIRGLRTIQDALRRATAALEAARVRESAAAAELAALRIRNAATPIEEYEDIVRHAAIVEERYSALLTEMHGFFTTEAERLAGL